MSKFVSMSFALVLAVSAINVARADGSQKDVKGTDGKAEVRVPASTHSDEVTQSDEKDSDGDKGFHSTARERRY